MRNRLLSTILLLFPWLISSARSEIVRTRQVLGGGAIFIECDINGVGSNAVVVPGHAKFTLLRTVTIANVEFWVIRFTDWEKPTKAEGSTVEKARSNWALDGDKPAVTSVLDRYGSYYTYNVDPGTGALQFFKATESDLETYTRPLFAQFSPSYGAATLPFKLRRDDFTKDLTIAGLGGMRVNTRSRDLSVGLVFGIGLASVTVDSTSTGGKVLEATDRSAISMPLGLVLEWKQLQFGVFVGWDNLSRRDRDGWVYQGDRWFACGVGYSIFSEQKTNGRSNLGENKSD